MCDKSDCGKSASEGWSRDYKKAWLKTKGIMCPTCGANPKGIPHKDGGWITCPECHGLLYVEKEQKK